MEFVISLVFRLEGAVVGEDDAVFHSVLVPQGDHGLDWGGTEKCPIKNGGGGDPWIGLHVDWLAMTMGFWRQYRLLPFREGL